MTDAIDYLEGYLKGKSDGRKEVADWIRNHNEITWREGEPPLVMRVYPEEEFEEQLKEWGL